MKLHTLVLEGDKETEKKVKEEHLPAYTKSDYLHRKRRESLLPLFNRNFYLCRMIEEELKGTEIDGSGKITICAHQDHRYSQGQEKYLCDQYFHISIYYLEQEQIDAIEKAIDEGTESIVIAGILQDALLDIAHRSNCSADVIKRIETAFECIINSHFVREDRIAKLTKRSQSTGLTAQVYRVLSEETGEGWYIKITDRKGNVLRRETIDDRPGYVDKLSSRLYDKAEWRGDTFVIIERFGKVVYSITV